MDEAKIEAYVALHISMMAKERDRGGSLTALQDRKLRAAMEALSPEELREAQKRVNAQWQPKE